MEHRCVMEQLQGRLLLAGAGKMGLALLEGWLGEGLDASRVVVQEPQPDAHAAALFDRHRITITADATAHGPFDVIVLAVKPQMIGTVLPALHGLTGPDTVLISIAAGKTSLDLAQFTQPDTPIVRVMPNTPAAIGAGISVLFAGADVSARQRTLATALMSAVGETAWIEDEAQMDAVTAVSGSGPAYIFLVAEYLADAGQALGLDAALARQLANATVSGAGELLKRSDLDADQLRKNVTSPGGTTEAALAVLMASPGLQDLLEKAARAAARRSRDLSGNS